MQELDKLIAAFKVYPGIICIGQITLEEIYNALCLQSAVCFLWQFPTCEDRLNLDIDLGFQGMDFFADEIGWKLIFER